MSKYAKRTHRLDVRTIQLEGVETSACPAECTSLNMKQPPSSTTPTIAAPAFSSCVEAGPILLLSLFSRHSRRVLRPSAPPETRRRSQGGRVRDVKNAFLEQKPRGRCAGHRRMTWCPRCNCSRNVAYARRTWGGVGEWRQWSEGLGDENDGVSLFALVLCFRARVTRLSFFFSSLISWISNSEVM